MSEKENDRLLRLQLFQDCKFGVSFPATILFTNELVTKIRQLLQFDIEHYGSFISRNSSPSTEDSKIHIKGGL